MADVVCGSVVVYPEKVPERFRGSGYFSGSGDGGMDHIENVSGRPVGGAVLAGWGR